MDIDGHPRTNRAASRTFAVDPRTRTVRSDVNFLDEDGEAGFVADDGAVEGVAFDGFATGFADEME